MIEVVCTRINSACVWLNIDQLLCLQEACNAMGYDLDLDGKTDEADKLFDLATDCCAVIREVCNEEGDC